MAFWDKYEGRGPFVNDPDFERALYDLKPEDRLFKDDNKSGVSVYIDSPIERHRDDRPEWYAFVWGFKDAADRLVEDVVTEGASSAYARFLGNPILTLYRHSIELAIKSILITAGAAREPETLKSHNLVWLWGKAVEAMAREDPHVPKDAWVGMVARLITELNDADANSENFRYGVDKKLNPYERKVENFDVLNLRRVMFKLASGLEGCDTWLYEARQARWEYEADMRQEYEADMREAYGDMRDYYGNPSDYY